ncbi:hypothetical protein TIFTF001_021517 [Ficus carica]|uniref:Kinesin motor domain-containing protein n=1 Tax=Ficus carica TaxID=3494 RepID=A0AA88AYW2_FICCA|nr:hypothetical protein TIFTF001_021517 [Ficus carica]
MAMAAAAAATGEGTFSFSVASVVEDVLQHHGNRHRELDLESRRAEEAASRRYEAAGWLRKMVGVVAAKDLPAEPSEEENFLVAVQEMGIPTFEASDLEQGGKSVRVVSTVLALKSYCEWKQNGGNGVWKFGGNAKVIASTKSFIRKNSEPFTNSLSRSSSMTDKSSNALSSDLDSNKMSGSRSMSMLVRAVLLDKKPEEVPMLVESVLSKVVEEFEQRISSQYDMAKATPREMTVTHRNKPPSKTTFGDRKMEDKNATMIPKECFQKSCVSDEESKRQLLKQQMIFDQQQRDIQDLKNTIHTTKAGMKFMQMKFHEEFHNLGLHIHGLANAASGYHRVLEENRKLYNLVQDLRGLSVPDANLVPVSSTADVIDLMNLGQRNRAVGATALNDRSSRSHSCLTVHVQGRDLTTGTILRGCMHLVDLAGSERVDKSEVTGDRLKEAQHINKSLSALGDVISSLAQKNPHVPYRNSKLTQLLQDSLGGQAKTLMFVHISPEPDAVGETISTLKFAERVATVELGAAKVNRDSSDVKELKEQIASLKAALARKEEEAEHNQFSVSASSEKYRSKASEMLSVVGNMENHKNSATREKKQSFDLDELLANSPPWPPVSSPGQNYGEEDKDMSSGEWVDKVMVNKLEVSKVENPLGCWGAENGNLSDMFYQKYLPDSTKVYSDQSYNMFMGGNRFNGVSTNDTDDLDAATSDSSEPDLLWQFNQTKLNGLTNGIDSKTKKLNTKPAKSPDLSKTYSSLGPSPSRKVSNGVPHRTGRQPAPVDMKRKTGNRK